MRKIKLAIVCAFSNSDVRKELPLGRRRVYNWMKCLTGRKTSDNAIYGDVSSWVTNCIDNFKSRSDVDLTIISVHGGLKHNDVHFVKDGINYYFIKGEAATLLKHLIKSPTLWHALNPMRRHVHKIINQVKPDAIAMIGAENAYISGTVLGLEKYYPVWLITQTIYNNPDRYKRGQVDAKNAYIEKLLFERMKYVSVTNKMHYDLYRKFNLDAYNLSWEYATTFTKVENVEHKEYDFVNFALHMVPSKGYTDAIEALAIVKKTHPDVRLNLVGSPSPEHDKLYRSMVKEYGLEDNVIFTPSFPIQKDLFQHLQKSRFAVLPYKIDYIASTTWQAMHYQMPVVVYETQGTPTINKDKECVLIAEMENVESLAEKMSILLDNPQKAEELRHNAKELVDSLNDGKRITDEIVRNFHAIIDNFCNGTPIPEDYLLKF